MNKIALFDFCETLTDFQTADAFVDYVRKHMSSTQMKRKESLQTIINKLKIIPFVEKITRHHFSINKRMKLKQLKGLNYEILDYLAKLYYEEEIKPHFIDDLIRILEKRRSEGWKVVLVSGGYNIYLKYFVEEFSVDLLISTRIKFENDICIGGFDGIDCLNKNKVKLLNHYMGSEQIATSEAYSDSISDVPFLKWVDNGIVVSRDNHQKWVDKYNFKEIIWTRNKK